MPLRIALETHALDKRLNPPQFFVQLLKKSALEQLHTMLLKMHMWKCARQFQVCLCLRLQPSPLHSNAQKTLSFFLFLYRLDNLVGLGEELYL